VFGRTENYTIYDPADLRHVIESLLSNGEHVEEVEVALDRPFEAGRERVLELALDGGPAGLGDQLGEGELERVEADLGGGLFVEVGLPVDAARLLLEFELLEPSLVTTSRTTGQLRGILARIAQAASQICALHERFGPEAPWGFGDPSGWKCSARYCSHHARCPGGAGL
jgi:hypothetical protein